MKKNKNKKKDSFVVIVKIKMVENYVFISFTVSSVNFISYSLETNNFS